MTSQLRARRDGGGLVLGMIVAAGVLNYADRQILAVLKPLLQSDLRWTDIDYGRMTAVFQLASAAALLGSGWLVDRIGWRRANPLAVAAWSLAAMAHAAMRTVGGFTLARAALGGAEALATPTAVKSIAAVFAPKDRSMAFGVMNAANTIGAVVTPLVVPGLAIAFGWPAAFMVTGGLGLLWVGVWRLLRAGAGVEKGDPEDGPRETGALLAAFRSKTTWAIAGAKVMSDQVWWLLLSWTPDLLHRVFGLSMVAAGVHVSVIYLAAGAGSLAAGWVPTRLLRAGVSLNRVRKSVLLVLACLPLSLLFVLHAGGPWIATALLGLTLAAHQGFSSNVFALATDVSPPGHVASVISIGALCGNLSGMIILQAAGYILNAGLGYGPLLAWSSVAYLIAVGWIQLLAPNIRPPADRGGGARGA